MPGLPDAERDASEVVRILAGLATALERPGAELEALERLGAEHEALQRPGAELEALVEFAREGGEAAGRVLDYLRELRGAGDGAAAAVPARLGPWREWMTPRFSGVRHPPQQRHDLPRPRRRRDPGE